MRTTMGQLLVNEGLPEELRDYERVLNKKSVTQLLTQVAEKHPERYAAVLKHLMNVGRSAASTKGMSVSLRHLLPSPVKRKMLEKLRASNQAIINDTKLSDEEKDKRIIANTHKHYDALSKAVLDEGIRNRSPYALQVQSGSRGNPGQYNSLVGADLLVSDYSNNPIPIPIYNNYSDGMDPVEYWAAAYGARKGLVDVKTGTADAGFVGKQLALAAHRQVISDENPVKSRLPVGLVVDSDDNDNVGAVLAADVGPYKAGTTITPKVQEGLKRHGKRILIHSPLTSLTEGGGLDRLSAGIRQGRMAQMGDNVGITAAQAVSEPLAQGTLDSKHRSGVGGERIRRAGFQYLNRLMQAPEFFQEAGPIAPVEGRIHRIEKAPQGGHHIYIGDEKIYAHAAVNPTVKAGDKVELGDSLTDGVPHPKELVKHLGVGEARRRYLHHLSEAFENSNMSIRRRNLEAIVAGMINHLKVTNVDGLNGHMIDDVIPYQSFAAGYKPREGSQLADLKQAKGQYLEEPVLHYSPGTRVTPRVIRDLGEFGIKDVNVNAAPPDFEPHHERLMMVTSRDPDWQTAMAGFGIKRTLLDAVARGRESDTDSTSYVPALAQGRDFGKSLSRRGRY